MPETVQTEDSLKEEQQEAGQKLAELEKTVQADTQTFDKWEDDFKQYMLKTAQTPPVDAPPEVAPTSASGDAPAPATAPASDAPDKTPAPQKDAAPAPPTTLTPEQELAELKAKMAEMATQQEKDQVTATIGGFAQRKAELDALHGAKITQLKQHADELYEDWAELDEAKDPRAERVKKSWNIINAQVQQDEASYQAYIAGESKRYQDFQTAQYSKQINNDLKNLGLTLDDLKKADPTFDGNILNITAYSTALVKAKESQFDALKAAMEQRIKDAETKAEEELKKRRGEWEIRSPGAQPSPESSGVRTQSQGFSLDSQDDYFSQAFSKVKV